MVLGAVWKSYTKLLEELLSQIRSQFSKLQTRFAFRCRLQTALALPAVLIACKLKILYMSFIVRETGRCLTKQAITMMLMTVAI